MMYIKESIRLRINKTSNYLIFPRKRKLLRTALKAVKKYITK